MTAHDRILPPIPDIDRGQGVILARPRECPADHIIDWHAHDRAQLLYAVRGVMRVTTENGVWVVPPQRAVWIPPGVSHHVQAQGTPLSMRSLYIRPDALQGLPDKCCVVTVSPLMRELIIAAMEIADDPPADSADAEEHRHAPLQRWSRQHGDVLLAMARMGCGHGRRRGSPAAGGGGRTAA